MNFRNGGVRSSAMGKLVASVKIDHSAIAELVLNRLRFTLSFTFDYARLVPQVRNHLCNDHISACRDRPAMLTTSAACSVAT